MLSCCLLEVAAHNAAGWIHGSIVRSPSGSRGHGPQRVPVGGAKAQCEIEDPIDRALFKEQMCRELDLQLSIDLTTHDGVNSAEGKGDGQLPNCIGWWHAGGAALLLVVRVQGDCEIPL